MLCVYVYVCLFVYVCVCARARACVRACVCWCLSTDRLDAIYLMLFEGTLYVI